MHKIFTDLKKYWKIHLPLLLTISCPHGFLALVNTSDFNDSHSKTNSLAGLVWVFTLCLQGGGINGFLCHFFEDRLNMFKKWVIHNSNTFKIIFLTFAKTAYILTKVELDVVVMYVVWVESILSISVITMHRQQQQNNETTSPHRLRKTLIECKIQWTRFVVNLRVYQSAKEVILTDS